VPVARTETCYLEGYIPIDIRQKNANYVPGGGTSVQARPWIRLVAAGCLLLCLSCALRPDLRYVRPVLEDERQPEPARGGEPQAISLNESQLMRFREQVRAFWRAPYRWGGASPHGTDCSGLVYTLYDQALDVKLPRSTRQLYEQGRMIGRGQLQLADLVFFHLQNPAQPDHVGIYIARGFFLHASVAQGVTLSHLNDPPFKHRFLGARRYLTREG
jgi:hypothetical protein